MNVKDDSGKGSEREKESWGESSHFIREHENNCEQNVGEDMTLKAILVRSQMEKRNKFLETEGHII